MINRRLGLRRGAVAVGRVGLSGGGRPPPAPADARAPRRDPRIARRRRPVHDRLADGPVRGGDRARWPPRPRAGPWRRPGWRPAEVTHLVTVSCTGFAAPGFDLALFDRPGARPGGPADPRRVHGLPRGAERPAGGRRLRRRATDRPASWSAPRSCPASTSATSPTPGSRWSTPSSPTARRRWSGRAEPPGEARALAAGGQRLGPGPRHRPTR